MRDDQDADDAAEFSYEGPVADEDAPSLTESQSRSSGDEAETSAGAPSGPVPADGSTADEAIDSRSSGVGSAAGEDSDDAFAELFEASAVEELDSDRVWAQLQAEETGPSVDVQDREIREFDKRSYCHQCPHFSEPPAVGCGHEGTTILELVDVRTFRVANCPVVLEEESLEER